MSRSPESMDVEIDCLRDQVRQLKQRVHQHEEEIDTFARTPLWKRTMFWLDGWPLYRVVDRPAWRPWRKWWRS